MGHSGYHGIYDPFFYLLFIKYKKQVDNIYDSTIHSDPILLIQHYKDALNVEDVDNTKYGMDKAEISL